MSLTLANISASVREHLDEPLASYWTDSELNDYIGKRQLDLWRKIYRLKKDYWLSPIGFTLNLVAKQYKYTTTDGIPSDLFRVSSIRTTTSGFTDVQWQSADPTSAAFLDGIRSDVVYSNPYTIWYAVRNLNTIWVSPLPQQALAAQVAYIQLPTEVVNHTDTFLIPDPFLDYVEYKATMDALSKGPVGAPDAWEAKAQDAWQEIQMALDTPRNDQGPDVVRSMFDYGY